VVVVSDEADRVLRRRRVPNNAEAILALHKHLTANINVTWQSTEVSFAPEPLKPAPQENLGI
jgi:hypothetical protein